MKRFLAAAAIFAAVLNPARADDDPIDKLPPDVLAKIKAECQKDSAANYAMQLGCMHNEAVAYLKLQEIDAKIGAAK